MKKGYLFITLIGFIIFLVITINYYLSNGYSIKYIEKNNIKAVNSLNNDYNEVLLPVNYLEYDQRKIYWGYINSQGEVAISLNYDEAFNFDENYLAIVKDNGKYGLINTKNEKILDINYDFIKYMGDGIYYYSLNNEGYLSSFSATQGLYIIRELKYDFVGKFNEGLAVVVKDNKLGYINKLGLEIIPLQYDYNKNINSNFYNGYAFILKDNKYGIINKNNDIVVEPKFDEVLNDYILKLDFKEIYFEGYELVPIKIDEKWGYVRRNGDIIIEPLYLEAYPFTDNNLARVKLSNGYYSFIDSSGNILTDNNYVEANDFYNGYAMTSLKVSEKEGMINYLGEIVIPHEYNYVGTFQQDRILTIKNGISKYHLINEIDSEDHTIKIKYFLGDDMTDCKVVFATDDKINYVILNYDGDRIYEEIVVKDYQQINYKDMKFVKLIAYEKDSNLEYLTYIDENGKILWKVYK